MNEELPIIQKTFDMLLWLLPKIDKFPRKHKYLLGKRKHPERAITEVQTHLLDFVKTRIVLRKCRAGKPL